MNRVRPILFNGRMVEAILDGRKTATRRVVKQSIWEDFVCEQGRVVNYLDKKTDTLESPVHRAPYIAGDILYVRETWAFVPCIACNMGELISARCREDPVTYDDGDSISEGCFIYRASHSEPQRISWRPSIHMPRLAARIWLRVADVRAERLQQMNLGDFLREGTSVRSEAFNDPENAFIQAQGAFRQIWDSTLSKESLATYGWDANPWVWVIEFER